MSQMLLFIFGLLQVFEMCQGAPLESPGTDLSKYFSSRIVGGQEAPKGYAPHMVALVVDGVITIFTCGGSLVSTKVVLTAAHCIDIFVIWGELLPSYYAIIGTNNWFKGGYVAEFSGFDIHPQWDHNTLKYDVGFLILKDRVQLSREVATVALNYDRIGENEDCSIAGWGRLEAWGNTPYNLQLLFVRTIGSDECQKRIQEAELIWGPSPPFQADLEICTFHSYGHGLCNGDSGSALVSVKDGKQVGIASWGFHCAQGYPDVSVRISGVKEYIRRILNEKSYRSDIE